MNTWDIKVGEVLKAVAENVFEIRPGCWGFDLVNGKSFAASADMEADWLVMRAALTGNGARPRHSVRGLWKLLCRNAALPAGGKIAMDAAGRRLYAFVEVPLSVDVGDRQDLVLDACDCIRQVYAFYHDADKTGRPTEKPYAVEPLGMPAGEEDDLRTLCEATGWSCSAGKDGSLTVNLDVPSDFAQASVEFSGGSVLHAWTRLAVDEALKPASKKALCLFLLSATGKLRMVRACGVVQGRGAASVGLEVLCRGPARPDDLHRGLSALSCAAALCSREVAALKNEDLARAYMAIRGWPP